MSGWTNGRMGSYALLIVGSIVTFFPLFWMIVLSLSDNPASSSTLSELFGKGFSFHNFTDILSADNYSIYFLNSVLVSAVVAFGNCILCLYVAYAFARMEFKFKRVLFASVLIVLMVPVYVVMIPLYREIVTFGWINSYAALTIPFIVSPIGIFLLRQYISELPKELEEAARIDGASLMRIIHKIIFPLARPALVVLFLYQFLNIWNAFLFPFLFTNTEGMRTLPVALTFFQGKQSVDLGHLMAGAGLSALPVLLLFAVFQKKIIAGLTAGAVKG
ncbi:MAG: carbohydrate ABC transporter permease [Bacteroidota bacterium]|nr:carbohydrate ABC transporter permease [Bacteroidota bacterium]